MGKWYPIIGAAKKVEQVDEANLKKKDPKVKYVACFVLKFKGAHYEFNKIAHIIKYIKKHKIQQSVMNSICRRMKKTHKGRWEKSWEETIDETILKYNEVPEESIVIS